MSKLSQLLVLLVIVILSTVALVQCGITLNPTNKRLCMMLPPKKGQIIGDHEDDAIAFCEDKNNTVGAKQFPAGFIKSKHFVEDVDFIQYTGRINRTKYRLRKSDGGGQFDTRAPIGAKCLGFKNFVNLIEPDTNRYCIRCCNDTKKCNTGKSQFGCEVVMGGGDYS
nr:9370_t:CDS:1 [Entrophospora candida]